jgi:hypothetical protein
VLHAAIVRNQRFIASGSSKRALTRALRAAASRFPQQCMRPARAQG